MSKYQELMTAIALVRTALDEAKKLHKKIQDPGETDWRLPDRDEIEGGHARAAVQLTAFHDATVKWEKELVSKGWRV
ncbi:hypothetical protein [Saccharopolyspora griseoalba]|uniref:Uncharacterized protein n=1 Tax=Saccharopolyspora griseoalba TaxID=1431848 RepID=A0ABW2LKB1_9PSEU